MPYFYLSTTMVESKSFNLFIFGVLVISLQGYIGKNLILRQIVLGQ